MFYLCSSLYVLCSLITYVTSGCNMYRPVAPETDLILFPLSFCPYKWSVINKNMWFALWEAVKSYVSSNMW